MGRYLDLLRQREMESQNLIRKGRVYINPGEKPPAGKQIKQGTQGGYYYETEGNHIQITHPIYKKKLTYSNHQNSDELERSLVSIHEGKDGFDAHSHHLYNSSDEGKSARAREDEEERKKSERDEKSFQSARNAGQFDHEKALPKAIQSFKTYYLKDWHQQVDYSTGKRMYESQDDAKSVVKNIIASVKPHSKSYQDFQEFMDSKINDSRISSQEKHAYKKLKFWYQHKTEGGNQPKWE